MKAKLSHKIFLSNLCAILITIVMMMAASFISSSSFSRKIIDNFDEHHVTELIDNIESIYEVDHNLDHYFDKLFWEAQVTEALNIYNPFSHQRPISCRSQQECQQVASQIADPPPNGTAHQQRHKPHHIDTFSKRVSLLDSNGILVAGYAYRDQAGKRYPIMSNSQIIGWIFLAYPDMRDEILFSPFFKSALYSNYCLAIFGILAITIASYLLSRQMTKPILQLCDAAREISKRNFKVNIISTSNDEIGELANSIKNIANELAKYENRQQRWLMDISHEMRTPLTILIGEIEAITDGITACEKKNIAILREEVTQIKRLVDDFHDLTVTDRIGFKLDCFEFDLNVLISGQLARYADKFQTRQIECNMQNTVSTLMIRADVNRLIQVLQNLFENCLRYVNSPGKIVAEVKKVDQYAVLEVEDSGPGVPNEAFSNLFDPFFRTEDSHSRKSGGAGLGLAICKNIIDAHNGEIIASDSSLGGLKITIKLPLSGA